MTDLSADRFVTVRDLANNEFRFTCHTSTLRLFLQAVRQRQLILQQITAIPAQYRSAAEAAALGTSGDPSKAPIEAAAVDALALCLYHYLKFELWKNSVELRTIDLPDFEDHKGKVVRVLRLKHPVAAGCLAVLGNVGSHRVFHQAFALLPTEALYALRADFDAGRSQKQSAVNLSERKFVPNDEIDNPKDGEWKILVDVVPPVAAPPPAKSRVDLRVELKSRSSVESSIARLMVKLPPPVEEDDDVAMPVSVGDWVIERGTVGTPPLPKNPKTFPLPAAERTGPTIPDELVNPPPAEAPTASVESGTAAVSVVPDAEKRVVLNQDMYKRDGKFNVFCFCEAVVSSVSRSASEAHELKLEAVEYREGNADASWVAGKGSIGVSFSGYRGSEYQFSDTGSLPVRAEDGSFRAVFRLMLEVTQGEPGSGNVERARLPPCFKLPLSIRFRLTDTGGAVHVLTYSATNPKLQLPTEESIKEELAKKGEVLAVALVDNPEKPARYHVAAFVNDDGLVLQRQGMTSELDLAVLHRLTYEAVKAGKEEYPIAGSWCQTGEPQTEAFALVSLEYPQMVYGIRLTVATPVASTSVTFHVKMKGDDWIAKPLPKPPGASATSSLASNNASVAAAQPLQRAASADVVAAQPSADDAAANTADAAAAPAAQSAPASTTSTLGGRQGSMLSPSGFTVMYSDRLGQGANGCVYRGYNNALGKFVAVKETLIADNQAMRAALVKEFGTLTKLQHANIVTVHALEVEGPVCRVFMEWMPSGSLRHVLSQTGHRMHEAAVRRYFREALQGLAFLHEHGICHLDIKPANMLLTAEGVVKLADFGTAHVMLPGSTATGAATLTNFAAVGTPVYMPPEMITNGKYYPGSDMWALACSVVELASGQIPWADRAPEEVMQLAVPTMFFIASQKPPQHYPTIPAHLSADLRKVLERCFNATIASRPSAKGLLADPYFTSDALPLDAEDEASFAQNTVAMANAMHQSGSATTSFDAINSGPATGGSTVVVSSVGSLGTNN